MASNYDALLDQNRKPVAMGQSNTDATQTLPFLINSITGRVLVDATGATGTPVLGEVVAGNNTSWTLAHTPTSAGIALYANGQRLMLTVDYSIVGTAITTITAFASGTLLADYNY